MGIARLLIVGARHLRRGSVCPEMRLAYYRPTVRSGPRIWAWTTVELRLGYSQGERLFGPYRPLLDRSDGSKVPRGSPSTIPDGLWRGRFATELSICVFHTVTSVWPQGTYDSDGRGHRD